VPLQTKLQSDSERFFMILPFSKIAH